MVDEISVEELKKSRRKKSVAVQIDEAMRKQKENAIHVTGIMKKYFGAKESEVSGSFRNWKKGLPTLYTEIMQVLNGGVESGIYDVEKSGKAKYFWRKTVPNECQECGFVHKKNEPHKSIVDVIKEAQTDFQGKLIVDPSPKEILSFLKVRKAATEMQICVHFGIPKRGGPRTRMWNSLRKLVEAGFLSHDYKGVRNKPYFFRKD